MNFINKLKEIMKVTATPPMRPPEVPEHVKQAWDAAKAPEPLTTDERKAQSELEEIGIGMSDKSWGFKRRTDEAGASLGVRSADDYAEPEKSPGITLAGHQTLVMHARQQGKSVAMEEMTRQQSRLGGVEVRDRDYTRYRQGFLRLKSGLVDTHDAEFVPAWARGKNSASPYVRAHVKKFTKAKNVHAFFAPDDPAGWCRFECFYDEVK